MPTSHDATWMRARFSWSPWNRFVCDSEAHAEPAADGRRRPDRIDRPATQIATKEPRSMVRMPRA